MTYRISRTILDGQNLGDFPARVAAFAVEMRDWRAHMARVVEDEKNGVTGIEKHMAHPRPIENVLVSAAVNENDEMDYEIVDDGPTAEQILRTKKNHLLGIVQGLEQEAIGQLVPAGRLRLMNLREGDIQKSDTDRFQNLTEKKMQAWEDWADRHNSRGLLKKVGDAIGLTKPEPTPDIDPHVEMLKSRPAEETKHLENQAERRAAVDRIMRVGAQAQHDIEDLTAENIDGWKAPDFKGI